MSCPTEIRDSVKTIHRDRIRGTSHSNLPQVVSKDGDLFYITLGERGKKSSSRTLATDLNVNHALACLPIDEIPEEIWSLAAAIEFNKDKVILYTKK